MITRKMKSCSVLLCGAVFASKEHKALPTPLLQFTSRVETTAHQLNATNSYPPYKRYMTVYYDFPARRARLDFEPVPHTPPKSFVRRYDLGFEWMVMEIGKKKECQKSRMLEAMPMPRYPEDFIYMGQTRVRGQVCEHWREDRGEESVEYFQSVATGAPLRLTTEHVESVKPLRVTTPLMTYDFYRFEAEPPAEELFKLKSSSSSTVFETDAVLSVADCERVAQDVGFPFIHFAHTYYYT